VRDQNEVQGRDALQGDYSVKEAALLTTGEMVRLWNGTELSRSALARLAASVGVKMNHESLGPGEKLWHATNFLSAGARTAADIASYWSNDLKGVLPMISSTPIDNDEKIYGNQGVSVGLVLNAKSPKFVCHAFCYDDCGFQNPLGSHEADGATGGPEWSVTSNVSTMTPSSTNWAAEVARLKSMVEERSSSAIETWIAKPYCDDDDDLKPLLADRPWLHSFNPTATAYFADMSKATEAVVSVKLPDAVLAVGMHFREAVFEKADNVPAAVKTKAHQEATALQAALKDAFKVDVPLAAAFGSAWAGI
jgi:hypothetical protein